MTRHDYPHEARPKAQVPVGVTALPVPCSSDALSPYLRSRGLGPEIAQENGWYMSTAAGDSYLRLVIPCINTKGYAYWQGRAVDATAARRYQSPSYSSSDSLAIVWPSGDSNLAALVEGPMDALAAAEAGVVGVATMGKKPSDEVLEHVLTLFRHYRLLVIPDRADIDAGVVTSSRIASRYGVYAPVIPPRAKDLATMTERERSAFFAPYI